MNIGTSRVVLRVRAAADILDLAAPLCLRGWRLLLPLAGFVLLPAFVFCLWAFYRLHWNWPQVWLAAVILGPFCQAPFTIACGDLIFLGPREARVATTLKRALRRLPAFLISYIVVRLCHVLGLSILVLVFFTLMAFLVVPEAVLLEGAGGFASLARSTRAVRGRGVPSLGIALTLGLLPAVGALAGEVLGTSVVRFVLQLGEPFGSLFTSGGSPYALAGFFLTVPIISAARFLAYIDLRTRKEGWDIQLRFMAIAADSAPEAHPAPAPGHAGKAA